MKPLRWVVLGVLIGFAAASAAGSLTQAVAKNGPSQAEAQASLARQEAIVRQIGEQWERTNAEMRQTAQMQMGPAAERAIMRDMQDLHQETKMLMQVEQAVLYDIGAHNK